MSAEALPLAGITFLAAVVNGALGYGFSSITVPLALLFLTNRVLNPALVPLEVVLNAYVLWVNRTSLAEVRPRVLPIVVGLAPGVVVGTLIVSQVHPGWLKFGTFAVLLPLILLQAAGFRRPIRTERAAGMALGGGVGLLYAVTTISGPPLAVALNNQGFAKRDFPRRDGFHPARRIVLHRGCVRLCGALHGRKLCAHSSDRAEPPAWGATRHVGHPAHRSGDI